MNQYWYINNTVMLVKTLENPLDCKEIKQVNPKGNQSSILIGKTDAEAEAPVLWPPDAKNWLFGKDPDTGKYWRQEDKGTMEDEMVGWYHWLNGHEFEQAPGIGEGQDSLACCSPWGCKESDMTEWLKWTESLYLTQIFLVLPNVLFQFQNPIQDTTLHCLLYLLRFPLASTVSLRYLIFNELDNFEEYWSGVLFYTLLLEFFSCFFHY